MGVVLAPANGKGAILRLIEAGAREIYFGFHDENWTMRFGNADINRMSGFGIQANVLTFEELCEEIATLRTVLQESNNMSQEYIQSATDTTQAHSQSDDTFEIHLFCTFNSATYTTEQVNYIAENYLPALAQAGLTGIIISNPQLIEVAHNASLDAVASTMCSVYNEDIARFYQQHGVRRVILPRDLTLAEIESITCAVPDLEYEVFLMRNGCVFSDSHCLGLHRANCPSLCRTLRENSWWEIPFIDSNTDDTNQNTFLEQRIASGRIHKEIFHENTCGLCALWRLEQIDINAYKVVGRSDSLDDLCRDVALTCENLVIAQTCESEADYLKRMVLPEDIQVLCTSQGLSCYYPEVCFD